MPRTVSIPLEQDLQMTTILARPCRALAMAAFLVLAATASMAAEDNPPPGADLATAQALVDGGRFEEALELLRPMAASEAVHADVAFLLGLAAIEASRRAPEAEREALLDEAIHWLRTMLVQRPELVRVRLELARAFFYRGDDALARGHFDLVLAGDVPDAVEAKVQGFLLRIRARRRWTAYLGASVAPDSNITGASDEETILINLGGVDLPFERNPDDVATSGVGVQIWTGGEYQHPLGRRLRLRAGVEAARREYAGSRFDETSLAVHLGPRWLVGRRTEVSLLGSLRRRWYAGDVDYDAPGARVHVRQRLASRVSANVRASWERRSYEERTSLDGPVSDLSLSGTWTITPVLRANALVGYGRERPDSVRQRSTSRRLRAGLSTILPRGFNMSASAQLRWTDYEGSFNSFTSDRPLREDVTRTVSLSVFKRDFTLFGFAPQLVLTREERTSNARVSTSRIYDYNRTRAEIRAVRQF